MTRLGKALRLYRQTQDLEQKVIASEIGVSPSQLSRLENGTGGLDVANLLKVLTWLTGEAPTPVQSELSP